MSTPQYSELYKRAVTATLKHEGGYVDDPDDPGGVTNWGISLRFARAQGELDADGDGWPDLDVDHDGDIDADDIRQMSRDQAILAYWGAFWVPGGYEEFPGESGLKAFDLAVNTGPRQAHRIVQRALRANGHTLVDDGKLGRKSWDALARVDDPAAFWIAMRSEAAGFYRTLIAKRPRLAKYKRGWLNRAYS